jgi:hypothetical protein
LALKTNQYFGPSLVHSFLVLGPISSNSHAKINSEINHFVSLFSFFNT